MATPTHAYCYDCLPGGPITPPPCRNCGSGTDYYSSGLCRYCHRFAPQIIGSCRDCGGWGTTRHNSWLCGGCRGWRRRFRTPATCPSCARVLALNADGYCRGCWRQAALRRTQQRDISVVEANRHGQQLFLVDTFRQKRPPRARPAAPPRAFRRGYPVPHRQLLLFDLPRDLAAGQHRGFPDPPDPTLAALLDQAVADHARAHGWSKQPRNSTRAAIRALLSIQDTPGAPIKASLVAELDRITFAAQPVLDVLAATGMLDDDREPSILVWYDNQVTGLPEPMATEVQTWFDVLRTGSTTPPRSRPRSPNTIRLRVRSAVPVLRAWAAAGHTSLREISRADITAALPASGSPRALVGGALRSLFQLLKARKIIFVNPTARIRTGRPETREPLPLELTALRQALHADDPARAALAALVSFHALRNAQLRGLQLTDIRDGRLHLPERTILLAEPARTRLAAWLDHRAHRWPGTVNPYLFVNAYTAGRTGPTSNLWINQALGMSPQAIREDRILHEAIVTGGDIRRLCDLFGLSVTGAERYTRTVHEPALAEPSPSSRTHGHT